MCYLRKPNPEPRVFRAPNGEVTIVNGGALQPLHGHMSVFSFVCPNMPCLRHASQVNGH